MTYLSCRNCLVLSLALVFAGPAWSAATWTQPTPEELKMTSDPKAPNAEAVYLNWEEVVNIPEHFHRVYGRIKILTEKGRQDFGEFDIPFEAGQSAIRAVEGRTIHADGTVIPFTGSEYDKELAKSGNTRAEAKVFAMPDVQVGSIVEFRYERQYDDKWVFPPQFVLQRRLFTRHAHYQFIPMDLSLESSRVIIVPDAQGHPHYANRLLYDAALPPGAKLLQLPNGYNLDTFDTAPVTEEPFSPPLNSFSYRLFFYYSADWTGKDFWNSAARIWSHDVDRFAQVSDPIRQAVEQIVAPGDSEDQKLKKIYAAVMTVENTRYTRERTDAEDRESGEIHTAADVWAQKRGTPNEITRLFVAMARAAGLNASAMIVTERDQRMLNANYLQWNQLTDEIAIVSVGGKDVFFDPGQRYCEYGKLHWMHTQVLGFRQMGGGNTDTAVTPAADLKDTQIQRIAALQLGTDGAVQGTLKVTMTGVDSLRWRQRALRADEDSVKAALQNEVQAQLPNTMQVKIDHLTNMTDSTEPLVAVGSLSGTIGTVTGKRLFLPGAVLEANRVSPFAAEARENPVDLRYPYIVQDSVKITVAPGLTVVTVPQDTQIPYPQNARYIAKYGLTGNTCQQLRVLAVGNTIYRKEDYPQLRDFFQKLSAQDQQQIVVERGDAAAATSGDAGKSE